MQKSITPSKRRLQGKERIGGCIPLPRIGKFTHGMATQFEKAWILEAGSHRRNRVTWNLAFRIGFGLKARRELVSCVIFDHLFNISEPQIPHLWSWDYVMRRSEGGLIWWRWNEVMLVKSLASHEVYCKHSINGSSGNYHYFLKSNPIFCSVWTGTQWESLRGGWATFPNTSRRKAGMEAGVSTWDVSHGRVMTMGRSGWEQPCNYEGMVQPVEMNHREREESHRKQAH